ncbi:FAD/NAD(P)-binding protein [Streptomyces luteolus]|uniref:FAD/NAD(P)-binding protein n=1 Tax=Streptomyces luteolus TaxID=3043615 RepID=A0ABT6SYH5_9ACTN|nr:FAD/NAD(P)-binding protein [Streptomyces sp. B-S-A12]MDI3419904.1 FAD/NAD(P)-binding protein [Streptomyces sp. B-S-A12]
MSATAHLSVAVVGAGPRGTSVLERLCASASELLPPGARLTVHMVDPAPPGAGQVWRTAQSDELLMNTVASQVTLFTDSSVTCEGPIRRGPSLYEWASAHPEALDGTRPGGDSSAGRSEGGCCVGSGPLGPDDYPTRAQYGRYLEWVFAEVLRRAPEQVRVEVHRARAVRLADEEHHVAPLDDQENRSLRRTDEADTDDAPLIPLQRHTDASPPPLRTEQRLTLSDGTELTGLHAVVLAQGHLPATGGPVQRRLADHARRHGLRYVQPANPADLDLSALAPGAPVLLRGLGLNFFDHMALLTSGRGGRFAPGPRGGLSYLPSGREPRLYAGSRRGVPYQARGDNEKGAHGRHEPLVLTGTVIEGFRKRAADGDPPDFLAEIWPLVAKEVETVHYEARLRAAGRPTEPFRERFLGSAHGSDQEADVLDAFGFDAFGFDAFGFDAFGFDAAGRWSWERIARPYDGVEFDGPESFRGWLLGHLREDAAQAALGNVSGPSKAALDVLRDLRNELRLVVDHRGIAGRSRREHLDRWYTPLNAFLSIGPPRRRIEEMTALVEAGVLEVVGPRMEVRAEADGFVAHSPGVPGSEVRATTLIEARLPEPDLRRTGDALLAELLREGGCRQHVVDGYETGGLDVTPRPYRVVDRGGRPHPGRFAVGVPTEGVHWVTAAGARPGVDSVTLSDADAVARAVLRTASGAEAGSQAEAESPGGAAAGHGERPNVELASID